MPRSNLANPTNQTRARPSVAYRAMLGERDSRPSGKTLARQVLDEKAAGSMQSLRALARAAGVHPTAVLRLRAAEKSHAPQQKTFQMLMRFDDNLPPVACTQEGRVDGESDRDAQNRCARNYRRRQAALHAAKEGLTPHVAENTADYSGVYLNSPGQPKPYHARGYSGDLCGDRGGDAVRRAVAGAAGGSSGAAADEQGAGAGKRPATRSRAVLLKEEGTIPPMPDGAFVKEEVFPLMPPGAFVKEEVVVKREHEDVVDECGRSEGRPKRRRNA